MDQSTGNARATTGRTAAIIAVIAGLLALVLRFYFVTHAQVLQALDGNEVRGDASQYYHYAWNIAHRGVFSGALQNAPTAAPDSYRDPVYPLFLALAMKATSGFDAFYALVLLVQAGLGALTVSLLVLAARHWLPTTALAVAAALMAVWPHSVSIPAFVVTETVTGFLCAAALLATDAAFRNRRLSGWAFAGLLWSLSGMTNAVLLPVGIILAAAFWVRHYVDRRTAVTLALSALVLPLAWGIRSATLPSGPSSTGRALTNFVEGSWPTYHDAFQLAAQGDIDGIHHLQWIRYETDTLQNDPMAGLALMRARVAERPMAHVAWYLWKPALLWAWDIRIGQGDIYVYPTRNSPFFTTGPLWLLEAVCYIADPVIAVLMLAGIIFALFRRDAEIVSKAAAALVLFVTLVYSVLQSEPRYSVPFRGIEMLLATGGMVALCDWTRDLWKKARPA